MKKYFSLLISGVVSLTALAGCGTSNNNMILDESLLINQQAEISAKAPKLKNPTSSEMDLFNVYKQLLALEGSESDAKKDMEFLRTLNKTRENVVELSAEFIKLLKTEGISETDKVIMDFKMIYDLIRINEPVQVATDSLIRLIVLEGSRDDGAADYKIINQTLKPEHNRMNETNFFMEILKTEGISETAKAQQLFLSIKSGKNSFKNSKR